MDRSLLYIGSSLGILITCQSKSNKRSLIVVSVDAT